LTSVLNCSWNNWLCDCISVIWQKKCIKV